MFETDECDDFSIPWLPFYARKNSYDELLKPMYLQFWNDLEQLFKLSAPHSDAGSTSKNQEFSKNLRVTLIIDFICSGQNMRSYIF